MWYFIRRLTKRARRRGPKLETSNRPEDAEDAEVDVAQALPPLTLVEFCEPYFVKVCEVIRSANCSTSSDAERVRIELKRILDGLQDRAGTDAISFARDYQRIGPFLAVFADVVIADSKLPFADRWKDGMLLANIQDGREKFFKELDLTLAEHVSLSEQRLEVFQCCLGLGFGGMHREDSQRLAEYSREILRKLGLDNVQQRDRICPESYKHTDVRRLCKPVEETTWDIGVLCGALLLATMLTYVAIWFLARRDIQNVLGGIINSAN